MSATNGEDKKAIPAAQQTLKGLGFTPKPITTPDANPDRPLDHPPVVLEGNLVSAFDGTPVTVQLVPMGAQSARLRQVTFPVVTANGKPRPFGCFVSSGSAAALAAPAATHPMFDHWRIGEKRPIACRVVAQPNTAYRVFIGLNEAWWDKPGQRMLDGFIAEGDASLNGDASQFSRIESRRANPYQWRQTHLQPQRPRSREA